MADYDNMSTAHFNVRKKSSANTFTAYFDGKKICSFDGGSTCSAKVTPGHHVMEYEIYNDASGEVYRIGPFYGDFEAGKEYDIYPGQSSDTVAYNLASESHSASTDKGTGGGSGCGCFIFIIIAVAVFSILGGSVFSSCSRDTAPAQAADTPTPAAEPKQTQAPKPEETPAAEITSAPADGSGFVFPDSDTVLLEQWQLESLSDSELRYAINEIYARHGYIFQNNEMSEYFGQFSWYTPEIPSAEFTVNEYFNQIEQQNWNMLINERTSRREAAEAASPA